MKNIQRMLAILLCIGLIVCAMPFAVAEQTEQKSDLLLATVSDIHYYPKALAKYQGVDFNLYLQGANCNYEDLDGILNSAFDALKADALQKGLKYVVITGDLTVNGEYEGHKELSERLRAFEKESGIAVFVQAGNHDINNSNATQFLTQLKEPAKTTSAEEFYELYWDLGFDDASAQMADFTAGTAGSLSYAVSLDGYRLILPDAGKYSSDNTKSKEDEHETAGNMTDEVVEWVLEQAEIAKNNGETPLLFTHWNLSEMNYLHGEVLQGFVIDEAYRLQEIFADAGIHFAFSGHQHTSDIDITYSDAGEPLYSVITPTLTQFPYHYRETYLTTDKNGKVTADFQQYSVDKVKAVESDTGAVYASPYYQTVGFSKQHCNLNASKYLMLLIKRGFNDYVKLIQKDGSIVNFLKTEFSFDVEKTIDDLIMGGFFFEDEPVFTTANIMQFINDLDSQICKNYINNPDALWTLLSDAVEKLADVQISQVPCTAFLNTYGFGDTQRGGTLADLLFSAIAYMYVGNEDISNDLFIQDVLKQASTVDFVELIFNSVRDIVVKDVVVDQILGTLKVNVNTLIITEEDNEDSAGVKIFVQTFYEVTLALIKNKFKDIGTLDDAAKKLQQLALDLALNKTVTYKYLLETVLGTGYITYGTTIDELLNTLIAQFFPIESKEAIAYQISVIADSIFIDPDKDYDVTYTYDGPIEVDPTLEDMQLPNDVTVTFGEDGQDVTITWFTKYSVTGTDVEIKKYGTDFTGIPTTKNVKAYQNTTTVSGYGFDFGTFGILPWTREVVRHEVNLTDLEPDCTYRFLVGDFTLGYSVRGSFTTASEETDAFSFLFVSDAASTTPNSYNAFSSVLKAAASQDTNLRFVINGGDTVYNGDNYDQWSWALNGSRDTLLNLPIINTCGDKDLGDNGMVTQIYSYPNAPFYYNDIYGIYNSFDYGNCHFTVINTNECNTDKNGKLGLTKGQTDWLVQDLKNAKDAEWKILVCHEGLYDTLVANETMRQQLLDLIDEYEINLVLSGNDLVYARTYIMNRNGNNLETEYVFNEYGGEQVLTYVDYEESFISISAGSASYSEKKANTYETPNLIVIKEDNRPMYTHFEVDDDLLIVKTYAVNTDGSTQVVESFALCSDILLDKAGDVDLDGNVRAADARLALRYAVGLETFHDRQKLCADVDLSQSITAADARLILRAAVSLENIEPAYVQYNRKNPPVVNF